MFSNQGDRYFLPVVCVTNKLQEKKLLREGLYMSFEGKIAVVTGAGSGIGAGISEGIAKRGGKVYVTDLRLDAATQVAEDLKAKGYLAEAMHLDDNR